MILENIKLALTALAANKLRTALTMLGIIIGIASVIAIITVGDAVNNNMQDSMSDLGVNDVMVFLTQKSDENGNYSDNVRKMKDSDYFTTDLFEELKEKFKGKIDGVSISRELGNMKIKDKNKYANITLKGVNRTAFKQSKVKVTTGRELNSDDYINGTNVVLVSDKYVKSLYNGDNAKALGNPMEVVIGNNYYTYTIVGVYEYQEKSGMFSIGGSQDDIQTEAYIPVMTAMHQNKDNKLFSEFTVIVAAGEDPEIVSNEVREWLNNNKYKENDAFEAYVYSMKADADQVKSMLSTLSLAFMGIGAISLLVGGIGVMNIMIVSVTERTREIGTRKALGATNGYIRLQFITEAIVVCALGGIIGIILGLGLGMGVSSLLHCKGFPSISGIAGCVLFSMAFGVFFGYYPANKAAKLNPIEALRYE